MLKIQQILKSRTVWMIFLLFIVNGISGIREFFPGNWLPGVDAMLGLIAIYFRIAPKQKTE